MIKRFVIAAVIVGLFLGGVAYFNLVFKPKMIGEFMAKMVPPPATVTAEPAKTERWIETLPPEAAIAQHGRDEVTFVDLRRKQLTGREAEIVLERVGITVNKNTVPFETRSPFVTSGIRIGTPAATTHGLKEAEMLKVADFIADAIANMGDEQKLLQIKGSVNSLMKGFPLYRNRLK